MYPYPLPRQKIAMNFPTENISLTAQVKQLQFELAMKNKEVESLKLQLNQKSLANSMNAPGSQLDFGISTQQLANTLQIEEQYPTDEDKQKIIDDLTMMLNQANEELLEINEKNIQSRKMQQNEPDIETLKQDIDLMRQTMAEEEQQKAQDKADIIMLREENSNLVEKVQYLTDQLISLKKCFNGLKSVCQGAEDRILQIIEGDDYGQLDITVGEGRVMWK